MTTYGTWLRGDRRGWVENGVIFPPDPVLETADRARMLHDPFFFADEQWYEIGDWLGTEMIERLSLRIYAMTVQALSEIGCAMRTDKPHSESVGTHSVPYLLRIYAMTVQVWHVHFVIAPTHHDVGDVAKCAKEAARYHLRPGRPIWTDGYDKRFCFEPGITRTRIAYVERHNTERNRPARPWPWLTPFEL